VHRLARLLLPCLAALAAIGAAGCASTKEQVRTLGETEGLYIEVDELTYQVQMSRILNPSSRDDQAYLMGLAEGVDIGADEVWFAVFMRVENQTDETHPAADQFEITDTTEKTYRPVLLDPDANAFVYRPEPVAPGVIVPEPDTPAFNGPIQGELLLFKVDVESLYNRPLEFEISSTRGGGTGLISIDV
jgi:hypothetical protein